MNNLPSLDTKIFFNLIYKKRKILFLIIILTAIVSLIISYIIPPKYKTIAVVYPAHLSPYSEESQTEQLLQYLNSAAVRNAVIKKMNLVHHYKIDTTKPDYKSLLDYTYKKNISFSPTLYESIEIEVRDRKPEMTKAIAECIIQTTDSLILHLKKKIITEEYTNYENEINRIRQRTDSLNSIIISFQNKYNIFDAHYQAKYLSKKITNDKPSEEQKKIIDALKNKREYIEILKKEIEGEIISLNDLKKERDRLEVDLKGQLHFSQIISPPYVPDKKYFPVRWLIISLSEISVISIFIIYLLFTNQVKE